MHRRPQSLNTRAPRRPLPSNVVSRRGRHPPLRLRTRVRVLHRPLQLRVVHVAGNTPPAPTARHRVTPLAAKLPRPPASPILEGLPARFTLRHRSHRLQDFPEAFPDAISPRNLGWGRGCAPPKKRGVALRCKTDRLAVESGAPNERITCRPGFGLSSSSLLCWPSLAFSVGDACLGNRSRSLHWRKASTRRATSVPSSTPTTRKRKRLGAERAATAATSGTRHPGSPC